ncbi:hypothetical protein VU06_03060 [Desulfobulbus sp. F3]|nr:hypothetical protein [Desulfobulbus sp. F3]
MISACLGIPPSAHVQKICREQQARICWNVSKQTIIGHAISGVYNIGCSMQSLFFYAVDPHDLRIEKSCTLGKFSMNLFRETAWLAASSVRVKLIQGCSAQAAAEPAFRHYCRPLSVFFEKEAGFLMAAMTSAVLIVFRRSSRQPSEIKKSSHKQ